MDAALLAAPPADRPVPVAGIVPGAGTEGARVHRVLVPAHPPQLNSEPRPKRKPKRAPLDLFVAPSRIEGAGMGLFTRSRLAKGTCLGYYTGTVLATYPSEHDLANYRNGDYFMDIRRRPPWLPRATWDSCKQGGAVLVDGTCALSYVNCCRGDHDAWNCDVLMTGAYVVNRALEAGEEVVVSYGPFYWDAP